MNTDNTNQIRRIGKGIAGVIQKRRRNLARRLTRHIATCPHCQQRLAKIHRVELALMLLKTQPQHIGLLARANTKTLNVLKHSLRNAPQSTALKTARTDLSRLEKMRPGFERLVSAAACVFVVLIIKVGLSRSLMDYHEQGQAVIHQYYARNLDSSMLEEIFPTDADAADRVS